MAASHPLKLAEVEAVLNELRIGTGDRLSIHSHSAVLAKVQGGKEYARTVPIFDVRRTHSQMGLITEVFRRSRDTATATACRIQDRAMRWARDDAHACGCCASDKPYTVCNKTDGVPNT